ncbi:uncharacterized protein LOC120434453 isoform X2 [Oreochromis aureus]|uniref:uncharacterized protein LOC120434453 isoform X2 n=1 Tax=Oreochromis aureus TaxID=47969 RepID=UPI001954E858|nr:uncharacterized protein LOC120434453 isoform X2 [Oreochromis aureus]
MIPTVSKSDEGLYKCSIADVGESPESWLTVGSHSPIPYFKLYLGLCTGFSVLLVVVILLGVFQRHKHQQTIRSHTEETSLRPGVENSTASFKSPSAHTVPVVVSIAEENHETYSLITKTTMSKEDRALESVQETNAMARKPSDVKEMAVGGGKEVPAPN